MPKPWTFCLDCAAGFSFYHFSLTPTIQPCLCQLGLLIWGIIKCWDLVLLSDVIIVCLLGRWGQPRNEKKGLYLNNSIMFLTPILAAQERLHCFWRKSAFGAMAVAACVLPTVWTSVGGKEKIWGKFLSEWTGNSKTAAHQLAASHPKGCRCVCECVCVLHILDDYIRKIISIHVCWINSSRPSAMEVFSGWKSENLTAMSETGHPFLTEAGESSQSVPQVYSGWVGKARSKLMKAGDQLLVWLSTYSPLAGADDWRFSSPLHLTPSTRCGTGLCVCVCACDPCSCSVTDISTASRSPL